MLKRFPIHVSKLVTLRDNSKASGNYPGLINNFLGSLYSNNLSQQKKILHKFNDNSIKNDCLNLVLLNLMKYPKFINIHDLSEIIDDFNITKIKKSNNFIRSREIINNTLSCLVYSFQNIKATTVVKISVAQYISRLIDQLKLTNHQIVSTIPKDLLPSLFEIYKLSNRSLDVPTDNTKFDRLDINRYKHNGLIDIDSLCEYISIPYDNNISIPLYEHYDSLDDSEKADFMSKYLEFNKTKQINVELNSLGMTSDFTKIFQTKYRFTNKYSDLLSHMLTQFEQRLTNIIDHKKVHSDYKDLLKYRRILKLVDVHQISNLILSKILIKMLPSNDRIPLSHILNDLAFTFGRLSYDQHKILLPITGDDLIMLVSSLVRLFIDFKVPRDDTIPFTNNDEFSYSQDLEYLFIHQFWYLNKTKKKMGILKVNPVYYYQFKSFYEVLESDRTHLPMLCPPNPWVSPTNGGYLSNQKSLMSYKFESDYLKVLNQVQDSGQLNFIYDNLNHMGSIPWAINKDMRLFLNHIGKFDQGYLNIPPFMEHLSVDHKDKESTLKYQSDASKRTKFSRIIKFINSFKDNILYIPHHLDFRGRVYPMVSLLSYHDEDLVRSLLMFWESKPLGKDGFDWIKYHMAGIYGKDKLAFKERIEFIDSNLSNILASANDPLTASFWKHSDNPWQVLTLCFELKKILEWREQGNPIDSYKCRIPIHQDGSCNGLQHYSALAKDIKGGKAVNLLPTEEKQDIYTEVLNIVRKKLDLNTKDGYLLSKLISRKLVKRPVMTQVYGVTRYGATNQILDTMKDIDFNSLGLSPLEVDYVLHNRVYLSFELSELIFSSIDELFENSKLIQRWLYLNCYRLVTSIDEQVNELEIDFFNYKHHKPMMWTSLTGLPIVQFYRKRSYKTIKTPLQSVSFINHNLRAIDVGKQISGVAPNFIHSLDSVHLLLTCYSCLQLQLPFVAVHDSFWTLPCYANQLSKKLREEFIHLHSLDVINHLYNDMKNTVKSTYQLVWFNNGENKELSSIIQKFRESKRTKFHYNQSLNDEFRNPEKINHIEQLIDQYKPKLYIRKGTGLSEYANDITKQETRKYDSSFTPILIKTRIIDPPPTGSLDIQEIVNSKFFFS